MSAWREGKIVSVRVAPSAEAPAVVRIVTEGGQVVLRAFGDDARVLRLIPEDVRVARCRYTVREDDSGILDGLEMWLSLVPAYEAVRIEALVREEPK